MIINYLKTAFRFLSRNLSFTIINIIGLTTGITAFLLIFLFLQQEVSFDKQIPYPEDTYRMVGIQEPHGLENQHVAITSGAWAAYLRENIPETVDAFRIMYGAPSTVLVDDNVLRETRMIFSEGDVIKYLGLPLISGEPEKIRLDEPYQALISKNTAIKFFGSEQALGKTFRNNEITYTVIGVFENENIKSHWESNVFLSFSTIEPQYAEHLQNLGNNSVATYLVLEPGTDAKKAEDIINKNYLEFRESSPYSIPITFYLQKVKDIYLHSAHVKFQMVYNQGNIKTVYIFSLVAILVLAIACINFINLATANSSKRSKEVGLRKVLGAGREKLAFQFIGESILITFFALLLALGILELILPSFNDLLDSKLNIDFLGNPLFNAGLILILLIVGLISGLYPAVYLSRFQAIQVLRASSSSGKPSSAWLRKFLVIFQFFISISMIMATLVMVHQVDYLRKKDRGYNPRQIITLPLSENTEYEQIESFRNHLLNYPEVVNAGIASNYNGVAGRQGDIVVADSLNTRLMVRYGYVNPDFFPTMAIEITKGRNFSHKSGTDIHQSIIINESAAKALGWDEPLGKQFRNYSSEEYEYYTVIGVVKDYNYYSLQNPIEPAVYLYLPGQMPVLNIRYQSSDPEVFAEKLKTDFTSFFPQQYFSSNFLEEILRRQISTEENIMKIFTWFSILCILISCLGLFGLTSYMVNQKRKEISLRKVLGGSIRQINQLFIAGFMKLILFSAIISLPLTYLLITRWLDNYPYHITIGPLHLFLPLLIVILIATITIISLSTRAARQNPTNNLKYE